MRINTNIQSQRTQESLRLNQQAMDKAMNRLSSGKRINSAADDAAGLAISTRMGVKSSGLGIASRNSMDGISLIETADSAMDSITKILTRMRDLALESTNGTYNKTDKDLLDKEFEELLSAVDSIAKNTNFNGINLLSNTSTTVTIQASDKPGEYIEIKLEGLTSAGLSITGLKLDSSQTVANIEAHIQVLDTAIDKIAESRANLGASLNRLDFNVTNVNNQQINTDQAASRIADADMAAEMAEMTKAKILSETSVSMLSQANQTPQMIQKLLQ